jgi:quercetin dioxygenase-like cupin family protein
MQRREIVKVKRITIGLIICAAFFYAVACGNQQSINTEKTKMETTENKTEGAIFPKGENAPADYFTGTVFLQMLAQKTESNNYTVASVTFEPRARSNWHTHPAGQTLIVINGTGLYQEKGKPVKTINKGETIICNPDIEHWHGASSESEMTHIAITNDNGAGGVIWLKPVTDEEYKTGAK